MIVVTPFLIFIKTWHGIVSERVPPFSRGFS
nr:MAG TPA: hypothetical protein [Caudoviricetes sp.]DAO13048.1 MAG TPA: hypothetical protein [Caudoviricetes sp.]